MRYSKQRELVLQKVEQLCDHPTAEEIYGEAVKDCPGLSLGTVYRNLNSLVDAGRVRRVSIPGKADRFDHTLCWHSHLLLHRLRRRGGCGRGRKTGDEAGQKPKSPGGGLCRGPLRRLRAVPAGRESGSGNRCFLKSREEPKAKNCLLPLALAGQTGYTKKSV